MTTETSNPGSAKSQAARFEQISDWLGRHVNASWAVLALCVEDEEYALDVLHRHQFSVLTQSDISR